MNLNKSNVFLYWCYGFANFMLHLCLPINLCMFFVFFCLKPFSVMRSLLYKQNDSVKTFIYL